MVKQPELGQRIRKARKKQGLTLMGLGAMVGVSHTAIGDIEKNRRNPLRPTLDSIIRALDLDPDTLEPITRSLWDELESVSSASDFLDGYGNLLDMLGAYKEDLKRMPAREESWVRGKIMESRAQSRAALEKWKKPDRYLKRIPAKEES